MASPACLLARKQLIDHVNKTALSSPISEQIGSAVKTGYLANITSGEKHIGSATLNLGVQGLISHPVNVMLDYLSHLTTGSERTTANMFTTQAARVAGHAFANGTKEFLSAMRKGYDPERVGNAFDVKTTRLGNPLLASAQEFVNTWVSARNKPFYDMALKVNLLRRARVLALNEGLKGAELDARTDHYLAHPTDQMSLGALSDANAVTFADPTFVDKLLGSGKQGLRKAMEPQKTLSLPERANAQAVKEGLAGDQKAARVAQLTANPAQITVPAKVASPASPATRAGAKAGLLALDVLAPFTRIGANIVGTGIDYSPAGLAKALVQAGLADKGEGGAIIRRGVAKAAVGTAAGYTLGYYLASKGKINGPDSPSPFTYRDDKNVDHSLAAFAPMSMLPIMGAAFYFAQQKDPKALAANAVKAQGPYLEDLTKHSILQAMGNVAGLASGAASRARTLVGMFLPVPPIIGQVARGTTTKRDTRGSNIFKAAGKQAMANIPGLANQLPPRLDAFGREQPAPEGFLGSILDPTSPAAGPRDDVDRYLEHLGVKPREPSPSVTLDRQKFTRAPDEQLTYQRAVGPAEQGEIRSLMQDTSFTHLPRDRQRAVVQRVIDAVRRGTSGRIPASVP